MPTQLSGWECCHDREGPAVPTSHCPSRSEERPVKKRKGPRWPPVEKKLRAAGGLLEEQRSAEPRPGGDMPRGARALDQHSVLQAQSLQLQERMTSARAHHAKSGLGAPGPAPAWATPERLPPLAWAPPGTAPAWASPPGRPRHARRPLPAPTGGGPRVKPFPWTPGPGTSGHGRRLPVRTPESTLRYCQCRRYWKL